MARYTCACTLCSRAFFFIFAFAFWFFSMAVEKWSAFDQMQRNNNNDNSDIEAATFFSAFSLTLGCVFMIIAAFVGGTGGGYDAV
mmetsp:Transcript_135469/g.191676  ORF Transcript_135469/g.191676 Transcript_135469/m.191676 type:complete len:85 (+) Transcript_135469:101-355(+)